MENLNPSEKVYKIIEEKIVDEEWTPGTKIMSENQLAKKLGVSRMSVREAIEKMVALNVLTKKQGGGTYVNDLGPSMYLNGLLPMILFDRDSLLSIQEFRQIVEVDSARLCALRATEDDIEILRDCLDKMRKHQNDSKKFFMADFEFHLQIAKASGNSLLAKVINVLTDLLIYSQKEINSMLGPTEGIRGHTRIFEAIEEGDSELAAIQMKRHIQRTVDSLKALELDETKD